MGKPALIHEEMKSGDKISQIRVDADIVLQSGFKMQDIVLIALLVDILDRHLRVEELIEIQIALPVMIDSSFSQIPLPTGL
jgi:hypothetical protein